MTIKGMYDTGGRVSFAPESLLSAPPPLYTHLSVVFKSLKVIIRKKDVFWRHVSKGNSLRLRQYSSILFAAACFRGLQHNSSSGEWKF